MAYKKKQVEEVQKEEVEQSPAEKEVEANRPDPLHPLEQLPDNPPADKADLPSKKEVEDGKSRTDISPRRDAVTPPHAQ